MGKIPQPPAHSVPLIKSYQINDTQTGLKEIYPVI